MKIHSTPTPKPTFQPVTVTFETYDELANVVIALGMTPTPARECRLEYCPQTYAKVRPFNGLAGVTVFNALLPILQESA